MTDTASTGSAPANTGSTETLSNLMHEERSFEPPAELAAHANVTVDDYQAAEEDRLGFWAKQAER
ncbi:MAG: hypothetical protein WAK18_02535, partial [Nocardioidaceae bacterium]